MKNNEPTLFDYLKTDNPFKNARIYLSGTFSKSTQEILFELANAQAITKMGLAKTTNVIIAGKNQSQDDINKIATLQNDGFYIPIISESDMYEILSSSKYVKFQEPIKSINITTHFIFDNQFPKIVHIDSSKNTHPLGQKEIYMQGDVEKRFLLWQSLGNIGAYVTNKFNPKTTDYCWLEYDTIELLEKDIKDEFIECISTAYNNSNSDKFTYKFLLANEVIEWMNARAKRIGDQISLNLLA